jgi:hypothetical protein
MLEIQKNKKIKRADQILPEVYGITLRSVNSNKKQISPKPCQCRSPDYWADKTKVCIGDAHF